MDARLRLSTDDWILTLTLSPLALLAFAQLAHEDFRFWPETMLSHIQAPTLVVWGDSDHILDISAASKVTKAIPDAELVVVEVCPAASMHSQKKNPPTETQPPFPLH